MSLLKEYPEKKTDEFAKDLFLVMNLLKNVDQEYADVAIEFIHDYTHFKRLLKDWNSKYPLLNLTITEDGIELKIKICIKDNMEGAINNCLKIDNLRKINGRDMMSYKKSILNRMELSYLGTGDSLNTLTLEMDNGNVIMIFSPKDMIDTSSPEFKLCAYYALKDTNTMDLQKNANYFSFDTSVEAIEGKGIPYLDRVKIFDKI